MIEAGGSSKIVDGAWLFKEFYGCICGKYFDAEATFPLDGSDEDRITLIRSLVADVKARMRVCSMSHQGIIGLDAIDGTI